jgi:nucleotide-binding universal stress UspA family protein
MFKKIVVPLDGRPETERSIRVASVVAGAAGVALELVTGRAGGLLFNPRKNLHQAAHRAGVQDYSVRVGQGFIQDLLDRIVAEDDVLVCMTSDCRSGFHQRLFGSLGSTLIRDTKAPFLVVGPRCDVVREWRPENVIVCTDGSDTSRSVLPLVQDWIQATSASAKVVEVVDPDDVPRLQESGSDVVEANVVRLIADELGGADAVDWDVLHADDPARAIVDAARGVPNTVIALATHGRSGLARITLGSVTDAVVRNAPCPILTVRPEHLRTD